MPTWLREHKNSQNLSSGSNSHLMRTPQAVPLTILTYSYIYIYIQVTRLAAIETDEELDVGLAAAGTRVRTWVEPAWGDPG